MKWFGEYWPSSLTWHVGEQTLTPVGTLCDGCKNAIEERDSGVVVWSPFHDEIFASEAITERDHLRRVAQRTEETSLAFHRSCWERLIVDALRGVLVDVS